MSATLGSEAAFAQVSTSLDPYGQLIKMLMPRALCIAIYDRAGAALWVSDGCDTVDLQEVVEETIANEKVLATDPATADGFVSAWNGESAYVFLLRNEANHLLGAVGIACANAGNGPRPFSLMRGLLRPALEVLGRELVSQYNIGDLQKNLSVRDGDLELLLDTAGASDEGDADDFASLVENCLQHLGCAFGAISIPEKNILVSRTAAGIAPAAVSEVLANTHRHLLAWSQVQRRTMALNKVSGTPLGGVPYKILSCPILEGSQRVVGILTLFKTTAQPDFDLRQVRIVELLARRIAHVLRNAYDPATGLLTRPAFEKRAFAALAATPNANHCVIYADLDRLHVLNENHGMHVGDDVIAKIADMVRTTVAPGVAAARISGDRFAVFLPETSLDAAQQFAWRLCRGAQGLNYQISGKNVDVSASFGVAAIKSSEHPLSHALAEAEAACKAAKDRGRGRVEAYHDADVSIIRRYEDVLVIGGVKDAIANDRFRLDAQPIIDLHTPGQQRKFELLLRMIDLNGDSIAPDKFLSAAERYQLAPTIDRWVVQFVLELLSAAANKLHDLGVQFAVNISGQSLGDSDFPVFLEEKLRSYNLPPRLIAFELTETAAVTNIVNAELLIQRLQSLGHEVALDDFGRGLSSLTYLKTLPVSYLKIDGGLVRDVAHNQRSQAMVSAIVQLARAMKLKTTAECIESDAIQQAVAELGVDYGQGFSIGRPRPLEGVLQELLGTGSATGSTLRTGMFQAFSRLAG